MCRRQLLNTGIASAVLLGLLMVLAPSSALAGNMWTQQALLLVHIPVAGTGGQVFTTNYMITATEAPVTINIKCFNDASQRIGPIGGVNVPLSATGQVAFHTPTTLLVTTDPLFTGQGWCWATNIVNDEEYNVQTVIGLTGSLVPNGILTSATSTLVAANTGLAETSSEHGGLPYFTTGPIVQNFLVLVNPLTVGRNLTIQLYDTNGVPQGTALLRSINARGMQVLQVPSAFGLPTPPASGSVTIIADGNGYLGWIVQVLGSNRLLFTVVGLDEQDLTLLPPASAP
jgi:hypothetical protein